MLTSMEPSDQPWHFEATLNRRALRWQAAAGFSAGVVLLTLAGQSLRAGSAVGAVMGIAGAGLFWALAAITWRRTRDGRPPLVLDLDGLTVREANGDSWSLAWEQIEAVDIERGFFGRRVVLIVRGPEGEDRALPGLCCGDAPPEWIAGLIETFRRRGLHPS